MAKNSISATALSELAICQQMVALKLKGGSAAPSPEQAKWLARGTNMHASSERAAKEVAAGSATPGKGACFIATAIYGPTHPSTIQLRSFRDRALRPSRMGRRIIGIYYRTSPPIAAYLSRHPWACALVRQGLDAFVRMTGRASASRADTQAES